MPILLIGLGGLFLFSAYKGGISDTLEAIKTKTSDLPLKQLGVIGAIGAGTYYYAPATRTPITLLITTFALTLDYGLKENK